MIHDSRFTSRICHIMGFSVGLAVLEEFSLSMIAFPVFLGSPYSIMILHTCGSRGPCAAVIHKARVNALTVRYGHVHIT